jgi:hypothetical protein
MYDLSGSGQTRLSPPHAELGAACERMVRELMSGVKHGFFEMTVIVETAPTKKTTITIKAGKSYRFVVLG